jgi:hypothetical protein
MRTRAAASQLRAVTPMPVTMPVAVTGPAHLAATLRVRVG